MRWVRGFAGGVGGGTQEGSSEAGHRKQDLTEGKAHAHLHVCVSGPALATYLQVKVLQSV